MLTNIYLVRHAHSTYTPDELNRPLSKQGYEDAECVTKLLKNQQIDIIYASPYKRAIQTVEGIAARLDEKIINEEDFKERRVAEGSVEDFESAIQKVWQDYDFHFPGGESNNMAQNRGVNALLKLLEKHSGKNIAVGTHGNIMVLIMNYFDSKYGYNFWKELNMPDIYKLSFEENSLVDVKRIWKIE